MQTLDKVHCTKLCCLSLLLLIWGALLPAYACPPEVDKAIAQLQKSARTITRVDDWLVQVVDKRSTFDDLRSKGPLRTVIGNKIIQNKSWAALFPDKRSLVYFKKYLAEVEIRQSIHNEWVVPRKFLFNKNISYTYDYTYPYNDSLDDSPESACQLRISFNRVRPIEENQEEVSFIYVFDIVDGKMKLIRIGMAG